MLSFLSYRGQASSDVLFSFEEQNASRPLLSFLFAIKKTAHIPQGTLYLFVYVNWLWHLLQLILHNLFYSHVLYPHA